MKLEYLANSNLKQNENQLIIKSNQSSNNNLSMETESSIRYIDGTDENNNLIRQPQNYLPDIHARNSHHSHQPVKFVS